jgi:hypothetical protein
MLCPDNQLHVNRSPIRRLTRFEYNNSVADLFGDTTHPGNALPPEALGNGFGNDADAISSPGLLIEQYGIVAEAIAGRATATPAALAKLDPCAGNANANTETSCARTIIGSLAPKAYRRPVTQAEADDLFALEQTLRAQPSATFASAISGVIQAVLQSPDFLYRIEQGLPDAAHPGLFRLTGDEIAARLSYLFWGTLPDDTLRNAAKNGALASAGGVRTQASRMLDDPRSRTVIRFFFDNLLPINGLTDLTRDKTLFPTFSASVGAAMHEETQRFLDYQIFEGPGTWPSVMTAPYTFVNGPLAAFYGITGVTGDAFVKVDLDTSKRLGLLTQGGMMTGTITTDKSNPVLRGSFIINKLLCRHISLPTDPAILAMVKVPEDTSGATARERFSKHSSQAVCQGCHAQLDPFGFALENFDPVGNYRPQENGETIDARVTLPGTGVMVNGGVELAQQLAKMDDAQYCFASHWLDFGYGRSFGSDDQCTTSAVDVAFQKSGFNVKELLLSLTQTDQFLYYPGSQ